MNPIAYHNTIAALVESQKSIIQDYEQRLSEAVTRAEAAEARCRELDAASAKSPNGVQAQAS